MVLLLLWIACDSKLLTVTVEDGAQTTVERGTLLEQLLGDIGFGDFLDMDITAAQELQNQGVADEDIQGVYLTSLGLEVLEPSGGDLSFLESIDFYVEAPDLDRVRVASKEAIPADESLVALDVVSDLDLHDYVVSESMTLTTEVTGHRPDDDTTVEARFALDVEVTGTGACHAIEGGE
jgi:hypothetical protein